MEAFRQTKCELKLQDETAKIRRLEALLDSLKFEIECCSRGGNRTSDGSCSMEWQDKKLAALNERSMHMMIVALTIFAAGILVFLCSMMIVQCGKNSKSHKYENLNVAKNKKKRVHFQPKPLGVDYIPNAKIVRDPREELSSTETLFKPKKGILGNTDKMPESLKIQLDPFQRTRAELENEIEREYL